ncbi:unnamed protein product [Cochlearia groenlandica]
MNLPSSTATPSSSTSPSSSTADRCDDCGIKDSWIIHTARLYGNLRHFCTHCLLRNHPTSFCPSCFAFYDSSPPHPSRRISCSACPSSTHINCAAADSKSASYLCPPCRNPNSFSFFKPIIGVDGVRSVDKSLSEAFYCAAKIASSSMNKAVAAAKCDAQRRGTEAALARKRAREALEHVVFLEAKEKAKLVVPKVKEASLEVSAKAEQKPKVSNVTNGSNVKETESSVTVNNGGAEKQSQILQLGKVKQEGDATK